MKPTDTSKDEGERQDGTPCGGHPGFSYTCPDCKNYDVNDPELEDNYEAMYGPEPVIEREHTRDDEIARLKAHIALLEESIELGAKHE